MRHADETTLGARDPTPHGTSGGGCQGRRNGTMMMAGLSADFNEGTKSQLSQWIVASGAEDAVPMA